MNEDSQQIPHNLNPQPAAPGASPAPNINVPSTDVPGIGLSGEVPPAPPLAASQATPLQQRPIPVISEEVSPPSSPVSVAHSPVEAPPQVPVAPGSVAAPSVQPNQFVSPADLQPQQAAPSQSPPRKGVKLPPLKFVLIALGALVVLGLIGFVVQKLFLGKADSQQITLAYWGLEEKSVMDTVISEYEAKNPNVKVQYTKQSTEDYRERLVNNLAKNAGPDIFRFHNTWVGMMSSHLSSAPAAVYDSGSFTSSFFPTVSRDLVRDSSPVGIPLMIDGLGLYINETIFNTNGKLVPSNWDDLRNVAFELTTKDEEGRIQQSGIALGRTENVDHWQDILSLMLLQNKADVNNPSGVLAEDPVLYFASFAQENNTWDDTLPNSTKAFARGNLAMYIAPSWRAAEIKKENPNLSFRIVPIPQLPKNNPSDPDITFASYWAEGVWAKSENTEEAWKFLKFLAEKETLEKLYAAQASTQGYGNPYPRPEMASVLENDPIIGAYLKQAPNAKSSYLTSDTHDGATGVNSKLTIIWKGIIDAVVKQTGRIEELLPPAAIQIQQVLASYR